MSEALGYFLGVVSTLILMGLVYLFFQQRNMKDTLKVHHINILFAIREVEGEKAVRLKNKEDREALSKVVRVPRAARRNQQKRRSS